MKMFQETQFKPTQANISSLLVLYGLELTSFALTKLGIENCTVFVETAAGKYVVRVYRQNKKTDAEIEQELQFMAYLKDHDLPVAMPIANKSGELITHLAEEGRRWQAILMHHMPGEHAETYSETLIINLATTQARMHILAAAYQTYSATDSTLKVLRETHFIKLIKNRQKLDARRQSFLERAEKYEVMVNPDLPIGLCHLDFDNDNVLTRNDTVTAILDFDDLAVAPYVMCLAYALWTVAYDSGMKGFTQYIHAYEKVRPLSDAEKDLIIPLTLFRHYVISCIQFADEVVDDAIFEKYLELEKKIKNYPPLTIVGLITLWKSKLADLYNENNEQIAYDIVGSLAGGELWDE